jgi:hypothetical protein
MDELDGAGDPKGYTIASFIGRLFLGQTTETAVLFPDRVRWSAIEDSATWTGTGTGYIDLNDTDGSVRKLLPLGGMLVAYKDTSVYNLHPTGDTDNAIVKQILSPGIGCAASGTVLNIVSKDGLPAQIFLGQGRGGYNVYMYTGNILVPIGDDIKEELRDNVNPGQVQNAFAVLDQKRNQYLFFVAYSGETFPTRAWVYDIDGASWKRWLIPQTTCAGYWETTEETDSVQQWTMLLGQVNGTVNWFDSTLYQDSDGQNIHTIAESGDWAVSDRNHYATIYRLNVHHKDRGYTPIKVYTSIDGGDTWNTANVVYLGQSDGSADESLRLTQVDLLHTGKRFRVKVEHDDNAAIEISELVMELEEQGWLF